MNFGDGERSEFEDALVEDSTSEGLELADNGQESPGLATRRKICLVVEYRGSSFHGWQLQKRPGEQQLRTVQQELVRALQTVLRIPIKGLTASGRTDTGVHARRQVVTFSVEGGEQRIDLDKLAYAVSNILKGDLAVVAGHWVRADFHATISAVRKQYSYRIINRAQPLTIDAGLAWQVSSQLDLALMQQAAQALVGTHDFASFKCTGTPVKSTVRTIFSSEFTVNDSELIYQVIGSGFLKQMVRSIVGTLVALGRGIGPDIRTILAAKDRRVAGPTAPPYGLYLDWVEYPGEFFDRIEPFRP